MRAYKLFRVRRDGTLGPLFINRKQVIPLGTWLKAKGHRTPGFSYRPGWHAVKKPIAPHLHKRKRVWCLVELSDVQEYQRPKNQGGKWLLANKMKVLKVLT